MIMKPSFLHHMVGLAADFVSQFRQALLPQHYELLCLDKN